MITRQSIARQEVYTFNGKTKQHLVHTLDSTEKRGPRDGWVQENDLREKLVTLLSRRVTHLVDTGTSSCSIDEEYPYLGSDRTGKLVIRNLEDR